MKNRAAPTPLSDGTLGMKIRDAIDELLPEQEIEWRDEMHHQRRTASKENRIGPPHGTESCGEQQHVRDHRPDQSRHEFLFLVSVAMDTNHLERAVAHCFCGLS